MTGLSLATCDRALPPGGAPEWVHLLPAGPMTARDGRAFDLSDPAGVILAFEAGGIDLPIDYEHQNDKPEAKLKGPVPAAGWIKQLAQTASGLWGRVEWTATARELITRKEYRFLSPSFQHDKAGHIMRLNGAGLVHKPALHLKALASQETPMDTKPAPAPETSPRSPLLDRLMKALNLAPDATEEEALDALEAWLSEKGAAPDPKKFVPVEAVAEMMRDRHLERATMAEDQALATVNSVINEGWLFPGMKSWAVALCKSDPEAFTSFIDGTKGTARTPPWSHLKQTLMGGTPPGPGRDTAQSEAEAAICAQLGLKPEQLAHG